MFDNVRRVFGHLAVYGSGEIVLFAVNFLLVPVYTRVLTPEDYGALGLLLLLQVLLRPLTFLGLEDSFLRFHYDCTDEAQQRTLISTTVLFLGLSNGVLLAALLFGAPAIGFVLPDLTEHVDAFRLLALNGFLVSFFCVPYSLLRIRNQPAQFAKWWIGRALGLIAARLVLVVGMRMGILGIMLADVIVSVVMCLGFARVFGGLMAWRFSWPLARDMLRFGLPRVPYALLHQITAMSDRYFLSLHVPLRDVGLYQTAAHVASVLKLYPTAFHRAWMPFAFETMERADAPRVFARMATVAFALLVFSTLGLAIFAGPLLRLMTPPTYHGAIWLVAPLALAAGLTAVAVFLTTSLNVVKDTRTLPLTTVVAALVTVGGHITLIPRYGLAGGLVAVIAGQVALTVTTAIVAQRRYAIPYEVSQLLRIAGAGALLYAIAAWWAPSGGLVLELAFYCAVLAAFPAVLLLLGVVDRQVLHQLMALIVRRTRTPSDDSNP